MHFCNIKSLALDNKTVIMWRNANLRHCEHPTVLSLWTNLNSAQWGILLPPQAILSGVHRWKTSLVRQQIWTLHLYNFMAISLIPDLVKAFIPDSWSLILNWRSLIPDLTTFLLLLLYFPHLCLFSNLCPCSWLHPLKKKRMLL